MKIATKRGDKGMSSLFGGGRISKGAFVFEVLGELDELNSFLGWTGCVLEDKEAKNVLNKVQEDVYRMMAIVGYEMKLPKSIKKIGEEDVKFLEEHLEKYEGEVGDLNKFLKPGSSEVAARFHIARSVCRRGERAMVDYVDSEHYSAWLAGDEIIAGILKYINRLSDLLFILACRFEEELVLQK